MDFNNKIVVVTGGALVKLFETQFFNPGHAGEKVGSYILDSLIARRHR